eukprot:gnl/MRDRNA2_/MRDRNA2_35092_c0_seq1.p1 gnl/MRDRNA2_/MRDRNA2_35092_c0~~gnl/MRDRNA2_/MRDRNA2_35092_c0_seq1.p1  ORF type:complete len:634 (-),score=129.02 gnl/MRDRNA2_/MRDRNA2_35092_c0_seq1:79-1980(-)
MPPNVPPVLDDIPSPQLEFLRTAHGIQPVAHGSRGEGDLLSHLSGCRNTMATTFHESDALVNAALFHSIYGTEGFQGKTVPLSERDQVRSLIGEVAEEVAFLNCVMDRSSLDEAVQNGTCNFLARPEFLEKFGSLELRPQPPVFDGLLKVHLVDWMDGVEFYRFWGYRREAYARIAHRLNGKFLEKYKEMLQREPVGSKNQVPEMVRARQKPGLFEVWQQGKVSYEEIYSDVFEKPLRVAIVGCGRISETHIQAILSLPLSHLRYRFEALVDPSQKRRAHVSALLKRPVEDQPLKKHKSEWAQSDVQEFETQAQMLERLVQGGLQLDVLLICVPHDLHAELALQALRPEYNLKAVVVEKPLAVSVTQLRALLSAAKASDACALLVAEQSPFWPEVAACGDAIEAGRIGKPISGHAHYFESMSSTPFGGSDRGSEDPFQLSWRRDVQRCGGGVVMDGGLHWIRGLRKLLGEIVSVVGKMASPVDVPSGEGGRAPLLDGETVCNALLQFESGVVASYQCTLIAEGPVCHDTAPFFRVTGTKGEVVIRGTGMQKGHGDALLCANGNTEGVSLLSTGIEPGFQAAFSEMWRSLGLRILHGGNACSALEAAKDVAVTLALYRSCKSGSWEPVEKFDEN